MLGGQRALDQSGLGTEDYKGLLQGIQRVRRNREAMREMGGG